VDEYRAFYEREMPRLLRLCYLSALDTEAAADATQEAMARAWMHWVEISDGNPGAWVRTVALNLLRSRWRRLAREVRLLPRAYEIARVPEPRDLDLHAALRRLPRRQREAIALYYWADLPVADCAAAMGTSEGSVKSYLSRARVKLARELGTEVEFA
jgi:RNA polymerase sigma-70 factor (ECF subfamily)